MLLTYDSELVVMSVFVAMVASYAALDLAGRITESQGRAGQLWLLGGALAMGAGIWSMHFIGMLSVRMPIALGYDPAITALSLAVAVATSGFALFLVSRPRLATRTLLGGAVIMGAGVSSMHYTGMAALRMSPAIRYEPWLFAASVLIAVLASLAALHLAFRLRSRDPSAGNAARIGAAAAMGLAISGMHYTGMAAARFAAGSVCLAAAGGSGNIVGQSLGVMMLLILGLTLLASISDARFARRSAQLLRSIQASNEQLRQAQGLLQESEAKYRALLDTTSDSVVLIDDHGLIRYANPTVQAMFGYGPEEVIGQPLSRIQPERLRSQHQAAFRRFLDTGTSTVNWKSIETVGLRRNGQEFPIEVSFSEVRLQGSRLFAGFMRDCSERKEREARIARLSRVHAVLSGINSLIVRAKTQRELFEGACRIAVELGQFRMTMIGLLTDGVVRPAAHDGFDDGYVEEYLRIRLDDPGLPGRGPTVQALREGTVQVRNDIAADPGMAHWHAAAAARGYLSAAVFPLKVAGKVAGCLNLYAAERGFFNEEELRLLNQLAEDISHSMQSIAREEQLDYLVYYDTVTGLANRKLFSERIGEAGQEARAQGCGLGFLILDIARFKAVNDAIGQGGADQLLKQVAGRLVDFAGAASVARIDPDRFALLVQARDEASLFQALDRRLWPALDPHFTAGSEEFSLSFKGGIARFPAEGGDPELLFREAEAALITAKSGNERYLLYRPEMTSVIGKQLLLERKLRQAVELRQFELYYQPKVRMDTGELCGAEALLRWNSPDWGLVLPEEFVPVLEQTGLIVEVGRWVLARALADRRRWLAQGLSPPRLAVNLSPAQLRDAEFPQMVQALVGRRLGPDVGIELEITESLLLGNAEDTIRMLAAVRALGIEIAVDDFGTGYSSLAYLARLPISAIKIDRSFVADVDHNPGSATIVAAVISLARNMHLRVIAEGVDSPAQLAALDQLGCDEMQGFLFSPAVPADELAQMLREGRRLAPLGDRRMKVA